MQQGSDVNVEERFGHAVEEVRTVLNEYQRSCAERGEEAEEKARGDVGRFAEVCEELGRVRRELAGLEEECERLPFEAYRANMDGDAELEARLRTRHQEIKPADLETLRGRCEALAEEADSLGGTARGAEKRAYENARAAYATVRQSMAACEGQIDTLKAAVEENRSTLWIGQRRVDEHLNLLRETEQAERREARAEGARREEQARAKAARRGFGG